MLSGDPDPRKEAKTNTSSPSRPATATQTTSSAVESDQDTGRIPGQRSTAATAVQPFVRPEVVGCVDLQSRITKTREWVRARNEAINELVERRLAVGLGKTTVTKQEEWTLDFLDTPLGMGLGHKSPEGLPTPNSVYWRYARAIVGLRRHQQKNYKTQRPRREPPQSSWETRMIRLETQKIKHEIKAFRDQQEKEREVIEDGYVRDNERPSQASLEWRLQENDASIKRIERTKQLMMEDVAKVQEELGDEYREVPPTFASPPFPGVPIAPSSATATAGEKQKREPGGVEDSPAAGILEAAAPLAPIAPAPVPKPTTTPNMGAVASQGLVAPAAPRKITSRVAREELHARQVRDLQQAQAAGLAQAEAAAAKVKAAIPRAMRRATERALDKERTKAGKPPPPQINEAEQLLTNALMKPEEKKTTPETKAASATATAKPAGGAAAAKPAGGAAAIKPTGAAAAIKPTGAAAAIKPTGAAAAIKPTGAAAAIKPTGAAAATKSTGAAAATKSTGAAAAAKPTGGVAAAKPTGRIMPSTKMSMAKAAPAGRNANAVTPTTAAATVPTTVGGIANVMNAHPTPLVAINAGTGRTSVAAAQACANLGGTSPAGTRANISKADSTTAATTTATTVTAAAAAGGEAKKSGNNPTEVGDGVAGVSHATSSGYESIEIVREGQLGWIGCASPIPLSVSLDNWKRMRQPEAWQKMGWVGARVREVCECGGGGTVNGREVRRGGGKQGRGGELEKGGEGGQEGGGGGGMLEEREGRKEGGEGRGRRRGTERMGREEGPRRLDITNRVYLAAGCCYCSRVIQHWAYDDKARQRGEAEALLWKGPPRDRLMKLLVV
eukprot:jgi/Undpi1/2570/HiC_scaffold_13.g05949.m1